MDVESERFRVHLANARDTGALLDSVLQGDERVTLTITSPPYAWLKDYGPGGQVGHGQSLEEYLDDCEAIFRAIEQRTTDDGSLWIIADTVVDQSRIPHALVPLPFKLAEAAEAAGWTLRDSVVWRRDRGMPWSGRGRLRNEFEHVLHFVRSSAFKYDLTALREPSAQRWWVRFPERYNPAGVAPGNVWDISIPTQGAWPNSLPRHACPFPPELVRRIVSLSSAHGDVVFDPFAGLGTVVAEANAMGRRGLGSEIVPEFVEGYGPVLADAHSREQSEREWISEIGGGTAPTPPNMMYLRCLKFGRVLSESVSRATGVAIGVVAVAHGTAEVSSNGVWRMDARIALCPRDGSPKQPSMAAHIAEALGRPPLSKFGIDADVSVVEGADLLAWTLSFGADWWVFPNGRYWKSKGPLLADEASSIAGLLETQSAHAHLLGMAPLSLEP